MYSSVVVLSLSVAADDRKSGDDGLKFKKRANRKRVATALYKTRV